MKAALALAVQGERWALVVALATQLEVLTPPAVKTEQPAEPRATVWDHIQDEDGNFEFQP